MKILYLIHKTELPGHQHIIDFLRDKGIYIDIETIGPAVVIETLKDGRKIWTRVWKKIKSKEYIINTIDKQYDLIISNTHSSYISNFYKAVKPKYGYVDIAHDIFNGDPERFPESMIITFHEKHANWCKKNGRKFARCRWTKLDADFKRTDLSIDIWNEAIMIGTYMIDQDIRPINTYGFNKLWYKKYLDSDVINEEYLLLPNEFTGPLGILNCSIAKFTITVKSSCFIESLMIGILPILTPDFIETSKKFNDVLSEVTIKKNPTIGKIHAITTNNIKKKIELLKNEFVYEKTLTTMRNDWLCEDYFSLPPTHEALYEFIKELL